MDLFRRLFGKSSEEIPASKTSTVDKTAETIEVPATTLEDEDEIVTKEGITTVSSSSSHNDTASDDEESNNTEMDEEPSPLDPVTRPVGPPPMPPGHRDRSAAVADGVTQPLNPDNLTIRRTEHLAFGQSTDVGMVRNSNQDSALSFFFTSRSVEDYPDFGFFVVADGMGGHHDGEKASAVTTRILAASVTKDIYMPMLNSSNDAVSRMPLTEALIKAVKYANEEVLRLVPEGGTTVTAVAVVGDLAHVVHVGDSRAYLITQDSIEQITRDHSLVQRLIELDQLTPEEAEVHPQKNVLYRALGQNESIEVDTSTRRLPPNSRVLICSDGLWGQVEEQEIYEVSMNNSDPQQACDKLVALANTRGGVDNITAVLLKIS